MAQGTRYSVSSTASVAGVDPRLLNALNELAGQYGPIQVISGYRSPSYSAKVGGYSNDPHSRGEAVDAYINGRPIGEVIPLAVLSRYGLQGGNQPGFYRGQTDPEHVQIPGSGVNKSMVSGALAQATGVPSTGNIPPPSLSTLPYSPATQQPTVTNIPNQSGPAPAATALASQWPDSAQLAYRDAVAKGLNPQQATDFAAAQYGESGFNPKARNPSSGAAGLYQLLSPGYVSRANQLGGVFNPEANIQAILPDYASYYQTHSFQPGAAAAAVERSGKGAGYYAQGYQHLPGAAPSAASRAPAAPVAAAAPQPRSLPPAVLQALAILRS